MTSHWLSVLSAAHPGLRTHFLSLSIPAAVPENLRSKLQNRCMQVRRFDIFPIEAIGKLRQRALLKISIILTKRNQKKVRGYLTGSAYREYREKGTVHGIKVAAGLQESEQFPSGPLYTPSTKAEAGKHDDNIHPSEAAKIVGHDYAERIQKLSLSLYETARKYAMERGIIIADTKFEFGLDRQTDEIVLVDEVITPDSSRFWPAASYEVGRSQESYDKQYLRDWLTDQGLKKKKTVDDGVMMPVDVVCRTQEKYIEAFERITGKKWVDAEVKYTYVSTT